MIVIDVNVFGTMISLFMVYPSLFRIKTIHIGYLFYNIGPLINAGIIMIAMIVMELQR